jgi:hypothetical protein
MMKCVKDIASGSIVGTNGIGVLIDYYDDAGTKTSKKPSEV